MNTLILKDKKVLRVVRHEPPTTLGLQMWYDPRTDSVRVKASKPQFDEFTRAMVYRVAHFGEPDHSGEAECRIID